MASHNNSIQWLTAFYFKWIICTVASVVFIIVRYCLAKSPPVDMCAIKQAFSSIQPRFSATLSILKPLTRSSQLHLTCNNAAAFFAVSGGTMLVYQGSNPKYQDGFLLSMDNHCETILLHGASVMLVAIWRDQRPITAPHPLWTNIQVVDYR